MFFCELGDITVVGSSPEALVKLHGGHAAAAADRRHAAARRTTRRPTRRSRPSCAPIRRRTPSTSCSSISRATTSGASRAPAACTWIPTARSSATATSCTSSAACTARSRRDATPSICSPPPFRPARSSARRRCARWRSSTSSSRWAAGSTAAPSAISARVATWIRRSRSARSSSAATTTATRPAPASSPTACPRAEYEEVLAKSARRGGALRTRGGGPVRCAPRCC